MKTLISIGAIFSLVLIHFLGLAFGGIAAVMSFGLFFLAGERLEYYQTRNEYVNRHENVYVISRSPETEERISLPNSISSLVVHCSFFEVINTVEKCKEWLRVSNNRFYCDADLQDFEKLKVLWFIFQDGENINETWKEFRKRVIEGIKEDRQMRHKVLKKARPDWYQKYGNFQKGIVLN